MITGAVPVTVLVKVLLTLRERVEGPFEVRAGPVEGPFEVGAGPVEEPFEEGAERVEGPLVDGPFEEVVDWPLDVS